MNLAGAKPIRPLLTTTIGVRHGGWWQSKHTKDGRCGDWWLFCSPMRNCTTLVYIYIYIHTHHNLTDAYIVLCFSREKRTQRRQVREAT